MWPSRFHILLFALTESASFFSVKTVLVFYFFGWMDYGKNASSILFHAFLTSVGCFPLVGAYFADKWLGKFNAIFYFSIASMLGCLILTLTSMSSTDHPKLALSNHGYSFVGLLLIALGVGGIRTCFFAFTNDQFKLPKQKKNLGVYLSFVNFTVLGGSMLSTAIAPVIREYNCKQEDGCFSSVFMMSAILMIVATASFVVCEKKYVKKPPNGEMFSGIKGSINAKILKNIMHLYLPLSFFWALFDQQGSRWTLQATRMDGEIGDFNIKPDQMQLSYYLLLLIFTPLIHHTIYPLLSLFAIKTPFQKIFVGGLLAAAAFIFAASLEMDLEVLDPRLPNSMTTQLRVYNGLHCEIKLKPFASIFSKKNITIPKLGMYKAYGHQPIHAIVTRGWWQNFKEYIGLGGDDDNSPPAPPPTPKPTLKPVPPTPEEFVCENLTTKEPIIMGKALSYFFHQGSADPFEAHVEKPKFSLPIVRPLVNAPPQIIIALKDSDNHVTELPPYSTKAITVARGEVELIAHDLPRTTIMTRSGGVYVLLGHRNKSNTEIYDFQVYTTVEPNTIHMVWQLPQYICITVAEILVTSSVEKFSYSDAPLEMHPILQGGWWLARALGNLLAMIIMAINLFPIQSLEYILFAVIMVVAMITFRILSIFYKKVDFVAPPPDNEDNEDDVNPNQKAESTAKPSSKPTKKLQRSQSHPQLETDATKSQKDHKSDSEISRKKSARSAKPTKSREKRRESPTIEIPPLMPTNPKPQSRQSKLANQRPTRPTAPTVRYRLPQASKPTSSNSKSTKPSRPPPAKSPGQPSKPSPQ